MTDNTNYIEDLKKQVCDSCYSCLQNKLAVIEKAAVTKFIETIKREAFNNSDFIDQQSLDKFLVKYFN